MQSKAIFEKEVENLKDFIALIVVDAKNYSKTNIEILKFLVNEKKVPGVYVTLNKPFDIIQRNLKNNNVDLRLIIFIDAVTKIEGSESKKIQNCLFVGSPEKLSDISVAMDQAVKALPKDKFLFFDSLNTLALFNTELTVARFIYFLATKMREWKIKGIIISLEKESNKTLLNELTQFCDIRLDFGGE